MGAEAVAWWEYREVVQAVRVQVRGDKALRELMARDIKDTRKASVGMLVIKGTLGKMRNLSGRKGET